MLTIETFLCSISIHYSREYIQSQAAGFVMETADFMNTKQLAQCCNLWEASQRDAVWHSYSVVTLQNEFKGEKNTVFRYNHSHYVSSLLQQLSCTVINKEYRNQVWVRVLSRQNLALVIQTGHLLHEA